jgi:arylsulfatase A-like enzyme
MVHFVDWLPTILELAGLPYPRDGLPLDGRSVAGLLRGTAMPHEPPRFWQWNRYTPVPSCNAACRDGDWKLVRPAIPEAMRVPPEDIRWLDVCMYEHEHFVERGIITEPDPPRSVPKPPPPELYNIARDPLETRELAADHPAEVRRLDAMLGRWFEEVEAERRSSAAS